MTSQENYSYQGEHVTWYDSWVSWRDQRQYNVTWGHVGIGLLIGPGVYMQLHIRVWEWWYNGRRVLGDFKLTNAVTSQSETQTNKKRKETVKKTVMLRLFPFVLFCMGSALAIPAPGRHQQCKYNFVVPPPDIVNTCNEFNKQEVRISVQNCN